jgi:hypothetical protein
MQTPFSAMHYRKFVQEVEQAPVGQSQGVSVTLLAYISIGGCQSLNKRQTLYASGS